VPTQTVWRYPTPLGVDAGELHLKALEERGALRVHDAVAVIWTPGTSALFVVTSDADPDVVGPVLAADEGTLIHAEVDDDTAEELRRLIEP
jgi:Protein of unknown function (DUF1269)